MRREPHETADVRIQPALVVRGSTAPLHPPGGDGAAG
jgi:hypothetical protein